MLIIKQKKLVHTPLVYTEWWCRLCAAVGLCIIPGARIPVNEIKSFKSISKVVNLSYYVLGLWVGLAIQNFLWIVFVL